MDEQQQQTLPTMEEAQDELSESKPVSPEEREALREQLKARSSRQKAEQPVAVAKRTGRQKSASATTATVGRAGDDDPEPSLMVTATRPNVQIAEPQLEGPEAPVFLGYGDQKPHIGMLVLYCARMHPVTQDFEWNPAVLFAPDRRTAGAWDMLVLRWSGATLSKRACPYSPYPKLGCWSFCNGQPSMGQQEPEGDAV